MSARYGPPTGGPWFRTGLGLRRTRPLGRGAWASRTAETAKPALQNASPKTDAPRRAYFGLASAMRRPCFPVFGNDMRLRKFFVGHGVVAERDRSAGRRSLSTREIGAMLSIAGTSLAGVAACSALLYLLF